MKIRIKKSSLNEISKREQELKDKGIDPDLVGIPREFKRLAAGLMEDELTEKEKKKNCQRGNPRRDQMGRLSSKADNTSWTVSNPNSKSDCTWGQSRMDKGSNKRKITKKDPRTKRCGRDKPKGTSKSRYRCKDGSAVWEGQETEPRKIKIRIRKNMVLAAPKEWLHEDKELDAIEAEISQGSEEVSQEPEESNLQAAMRQRDKLIDALAKLTAKERLHVLRDPCNMTGLYSIDKAAEMVNKYSLALKGKMDEPAKNQS